MKKKTASKPKTKTAPLYARIREILESARSSVARSVNTSQVVTNWLIGREIVEEEQLGTRRAGYGEQLIEHLSKRLRADYGSGYSVQSLFYMKQFYLSFPALLPSTDILHAVRGEFARIDRGSEIHHGPRDKSDAVRRKSTALSTSDALEILHGLRGELRPLDRKRNSEKGAALSNEARDSKESAFADTRSDSRTDPWMTGWLHPNLSWTHYRTLLRVGQPEARAFYEIEALKNSWSARELERQINSLLFERLAKSRDKAGLMRLATHGQEIAKPADIFKDPIVIEFLGLPESPRLVETALEEALINDLQMFLLELGSGFAFVARQRRISLDGDHFYVDLVFYHTILKCYVLIEIKIGKLTHQDLGQVQLYVNYYDREINTPDDNPALGLILCTDKNDAVVRYTLGPDQEKKIFASRYKLYLPTEQELQAEIKRELRVLGAMDTNTADVAPPPKARKRRNS